MEFLYKPIGIIFSDNKNPKGTPIQAAFAGKSKGYIELSPEYEPGLKDLAGFSHIYLIYHFHLSEGWSLQVKPFLDNTDRGLFATRAPKRVNQIGLSIVQLDRIEKNTIYISDVDILDGTPLLDIKPFCPVFDNRENCRIGWMEGNIDKKDRHYADNRFSPDLSK
ncbi:tRNA (N6-threonylcarbamoyladenosine(37)-N6)-methyltransferase TrmO [Desulfotomaculum sp. 1211_IL3151]|uniref:tRNA (N6-threonylcarbamoyladenosine(37)-N6)-methyltransferase TrmO n=1 Tax=Desulfotomaculum sp. 1211_IL3151 TaxID=3084055 RepID=UPI002FDB68D2